MTDQHMLRLPALEVRQGDRRIYCFAVDGKRLHQFAAVSRIRRDNQEELHGYQRPEVSTHIKAIKRYLESPSAMLPNAVVLAFDSRVKFEATNSDDGGGYSVPGELVIPVDERLPEDQKPAWLVDGQQRSAAIREADVETFPIAAVGFIADNEAEQRAQFILVNNTKPLPKGLIHELLPNTKVHLPPSYARRQLPAVVMTRLNGTVIGPFYKAIATPTSPDGYIKDNSILKMIDNSMYEGALYKYRDERGGGDVERMLLHLNTFWGLVREVFPDAWSKPPRSSRLTHGVGIQAMGYVMDKLTEEKSAEEIDRGFILEKLKYIEAAAAWTDGNWHFGRDEARKWNSLQNTPNDVKWLTRGLLIVVTQGATGMRTLF